MDELGSPFHLHPARAAGEQAGRPGQRVLARAAGRKGFRQGIGKGLARRPTQIALERPQVHGELRPGLPALHRVGKGVDGLQALSPQVTGAHGLRQGLGQGLRGQPLDIEVFAFHRGKWRKLFNTGGRVDDAWTRGVPRAFEEMKESIKGDRVF